MRVQELEEARSRVAQMEKTMRWWSDCTANWREKWSKVRNERNKARDESKQLRMKLEKSVKECILLKQFSAELEASRKRRDGGVNNDSGQTFICGCGGRRSAGCDQESTAKAAKSPENKSGEDFVSKLLSKKEHDGDSLSSHSGKSSLRKGSPTSGTEKSEDVVLQQKVSMLEKKLEETHKNTQHERHEKESLAESLAKLQAEEAVLKSKMEESKSAKEAIDEQLQTLQQDHRDEVDRFTAELDDEMDSRCNLEKTLADLRKELERLQAENAYEWGKSESLETEKLALERELKKLHAEVTVLQEELERKSRQASSQLDGDMKSLQREFTDKTKELSDMKHAHGKLKKLLQDKTAELDHATSRADQYEQEVRKLRGRIDELKRDLANAEDEVDQQTNQVRRIQRNNDELQQQVENLGVQINHLQTRLRGSSKPRMGSRSASLKSFEANEGGSCQRESVSDDD